MWILGLVLATPTCTLAVVVYSIIEDIVECQRDNHTECDIELYYVSYSPHIIFEKNGNDFRKDVCFQ